MGSDFDSLMAAADAAIFGAFGDATTATVTDTDGTETAGVTLCFGDERQVETYDDSGRYVVTEVEAVAQKAELAGVNVKATVTHGSNTWSVREVTADGSALTMTLRKVAEKAKHHGEQVRRIG